MRDRDCTIEIWNDSRDANISVRVTLSAKLLNKVSVLTTLSCNEIVLVLIMLKRLFNEDCSVKLNDSVKKNLNELIESDICVNISEFVKLLNKLRLLFKMSVNEIVFKLAMLNKLFSEVTFVRFSVSEKNLWMPDNVWINSLRFRVSIMNIWNDSRFCEISTRERLCEMETLSELSESEICVMNNTSPKLLNKTSEFCMESELG